MKVRDRWERFAELGAAALFVVHDEPRLVRTTMLADLGELPFPVLVDLDRRAYHEWGLHRIPWWRLWLDPKVLRSYAKLVGGGERVRGSGSDVYQLGGDFVVDRDGRIAYRRPQRRDDRPAVGELLDVMRHREDGGGRSGGDA